MWSLLQTCVCVLHVWGLLYRARAALAARAVTVNVATHAYLMGVCSSQHDQADDDSALKRLQNMQGKNWDQNGPCTADSVVFVSRDFATIPSDVFQLRFLKRLSLCDCENLRHVPADIATLQQLEVLALHYCANLASLPDELAALQELTYLELIGCVSLVKLPNLRSCPKLMESSGHINTTDASDAAIKWHQRHFTAFESNPQQLADGAHWNKDHTILIQQEHGKVRLVPSEGSWNS